VPDPASSTPEGPVTTAGLDRLARRALPFFFLNTASATAGAALFARWMDSDAYGGFIFAVHVVGLMALAAGLGLPQGALRFLARYRNEDRDNLYRGFLSFGLAVQVVGGVLVGGLVWVAVELAGWGGHSADSLRHAWWLVPVLGLNLLLASVDTSAGRLRASAIAHGLSRHAVAIGLGFAALSLAGGLSADRAMVVFGAAAAVTVAGQAVSRWRQGDRLAPMRTDVGPWLRVSGSMAVIWGLRVVGATGEIYILRGFQGEAEAGAFHLATAWAALAAIPAFTYSAAASRSIGGAREQGEAGRVAYLALRRALLPTLGAVVVVLPTAIYFMEHPGTTHTLAEYLLLPLIPAWGLRGLEALVLSGLAQRGLHARATTLAAIFTVLALGVSVLLALVAGVVAVGWGVLAVRVVFVGVLWVGLRRVG